MDLVNEVYERISSAADSMIPSPVPVPPFVTTAATLLSKKATSPSFPYSVRNVDLGDVVFWQAVIVITLHPLVWNAIGRFEYYTRLLSRLFFKPIIGVYAFALWIFVAGIYRDLLFVAAIESQRKDNSLGAVEYQLAAYVLMLAGVALVLTSFYQLGITGTYLGDYFGILMNSKVTVFPFNYFSDPMYDGSTMIFMSKALLYVDYPFSV